MKLRTVSAALVLPALAVACAVQPASSEPAPVVDAPRVAPSDLQPQVDAFARSVSTHDVAAFEAIASKELAARVEERGSGSAAFLDKLKSSMETTFSLAAGDLPAFEVSAAVAEGDAVKATLRLRGQDLTKPFYFVREDGALKLNLAPPGFSKESPEGALFGSNNYTVHNENPSGSHWSLQCTTSSTSWKTFTVYGGSSSLVSCYNNCGIFSGSEFYGGNKLQKCDWNWFGDDVVINASLPGGWNCVSYC